MDYWELTSCINLYSIYLFSLNNTLHVIHKVKWDWFYPIICVFLARQPKIRKGAELPKRSAKHICIFTMGCTSSAVSTFQKFIESIAHHSWTEETQGRGGFGWKNSHAGKSQTHWKRLRTLENHRKGILCKGVWGRIAIFDLTGRFAWRRLEKSMPWRCWARIRSWSEFS